MSIDRIDGRVDGIRGHQPVRGAEPAVERAKTVADRPTTVPKTEGPDTVSLSDRARDLKAALRAVQSTPDVREDRIADLRQRIADGTYQVASDVLANDILRGGL